MVILEAPYFDGCKDNPWDFFNWINEMKQFFEQENFANNIKVSYAKAEVNRSPTFLVDLEYLHYISMNLPLLLGKIWKKIFVMNICHHTFELSIYPELSVVIFKIKVMVLGNGMASQLHVLKKIRWIFISFHVLSALLNNLPFVKTSKN